MLINIARACILALFLLLATPAGAFVIIERLCIEGDDCPAPECQAGQCFEVTGVVRLPSAREDKTPLEADELAQICAQLYVVDIGGQRSRLSGPRCNPVPGWIVAKNWGCLNFGSYGWCEDRPVRGLLDGREVQGVRVPVGAPCYDDVQPGQQDGKTRQWRLWREGGRPDGRPLYRVYCEREN